MQFKFSFNLALKCGWIETDNTNKLKISTRTKDIIKPILNKENLLNKNTTAINLLKDYILHFKPKWAVLLRNGRRKMLSAIEPNIKEIFTELKLYHDNKDLTDNIHIYRMIV